MVFGAISMIWAIDAVVLVIILAMAANWLYYWFRARQLKGGLSEEKFEHTMRKAQLIDLREKKDFDAGHILGARDLPFTQLKQRMSELRKDMPVYLYEDGKNLSIRAAVRLKKAGYSEVYWLDSGYRDWKGKKKKSVII